MKKTMMILLTSLFLMGCTDNQVEEDSNGNTDEESVEVVVQEDAKVFIQEGPEEISIRSENSEIRQLSLFSLEYDPEKDELLETELLKEKENIPADEQTTWEVIYSEGIPSMKLVWELATGEAGEYVIAYDGKDGLNEEEIQVLPKEDKE